MRINKFLSEAGVCSRRAADREILAGKVSINGRTAVPGDRITDADEVCFCGRPVKRKEEILLYAYYKPRGVVCTESRKEERNLFQELSLSERVTYMGRLDKDSEGLLVLTNRGDLIELGMRGSRAHEKEYVVRIDREVTPELIRFLSQGVYLSELDRTTRPCRVKKLSRYTFSMVLTEGLNRQIRRMCEAAGVRVRALKRIRVINILLSDMKSGELRSIEGEEREEFFRIIGWKNTKS